MHIAPPRASHVRYLVVGLAAAMAVFLYLDRYCLSFLERYIAADLGLSKSEAGWLLSAFFWAYALGQVPAGWLGDRYGARAALAVYIFCWSACTGLMSLAGSFTLMLVLRFGCGLAQAGAYPVAARLVSHWVPFSARALASGVVATGGRVGGFLAQFLTAYLLVVFAPTLSSADEHGQPWPAAFAIFGVAGIIMAGGFWIGVRDRPRQAPGCNKEEIERIERDLPSDRGDHGRQVRGLPLGPLVRSRSLWLSSVSQFMTNFGWLFLTTLLPDYLAEVHEVPVVERGWLAGLPILVGLPGMLAGGWLTDRLTGALGLRWGRCLPMALTRFGAMAAFACVPLVGHSPQLATALFCVVAVATDLGTASVWAFSQDIAGRHVGSVLGWGNMWGSLGGACSPVALTAIVVAGWDACFLVCAAAFFVSGITALGVNATEKLETGDTG
jgi:MFS transporter, ACS family, glucarate transporter